MPCHRGWSAAPAHLSVALPGWNGGRHPMSMDAEVLVIGAGPAGMAAATQAAVHGKQVMLLDDNLAPGGQIWREASVPHRNIGSMQKQKALVALRVSGTRVLSGWRVFDAPRPHVLRAVNEGGSEAHAIELSYGRLVVATGARERFLPFPGWTLPGVFGAGGLQALALGGFPVAGKRIIVAGTGPLLLPVGAHLRQMGGRLTTIAEQASRRQIAAFSARLSRQPRKLLEGLQYRAASGGSRYRVGCWPVAALGQEKVEGVRLTDGKTIWEEECDLLACGFHLVANTELPTLLGCAVRDGLVAVDQLQQTSVTDIFAAGEITAIAGVEASLLTGTIAGLAAAGEIDKARALEPRRRATERFAAQLASTFALRPELRRIVEPETIVCRCEDVTYSQLAQHNGWTEAKLQTRCGMGPCQARVCGPATEWLFGWKQSSIRPPLFPVPLSALGVSPDRQ
jgi:D-hydroxyproline dehydrogenase subunit alpha